MRRIAQDIKENNFSKVYLLCGEETYLRNQYRDKLLKALSPDDNSMNSIAFTGKDIPVSEVIDFAQTMPFFAERRVILIEDSGFFASKGAADELCEYVKSIPETACIVFSESEVNKTYKLYKAVAASGHVAEFKRQGTEDLKKWILINLKKENLSITGQALDEFLSGTGDDMLMIKSELDKLISYVHGKKGISLEDVNAVCIPKIEDKIFEMLDYIMTGRCEDALRLYGDLLALRDTPQHIMAMIVRQLKLMLFAKSLKEEQVSLDEMAGLLGYRKSYAVKMLLQLSDRKSSEFLKKWLEKCALVDVDSKSGKIDAQIGVELIIIAMANEMDM